MKKPKISVCIPAHNAELWISESIDSIINQTFTEWEIIVCNDASTDSTELILKHYANLLGDKFKYFSSLENKGIAKCRNFCNMQAEGEIICVQDADDISPKDRLDKTFKFFKRHDTVDLSYGDCQYIDHTGRPFHQVNADPFEFDRLKLENWIQHPTVAYRKEAVMKVPYRKECRVIDDWFLYYDFHKAGLKIAPMNEVLSFYRVLKTSVSRSPEKAKEIADMKAKFLEEASADLSPVGS